MIDGQVHLPNTNDVYYSTAGLILVVQGDEEVEGPLGKRALYPTTYMPCCSMYTAIHI